MAGSYETAVPHNDYGGEDVNSKSYLVAKALLLETLPAAVTQL